MVAAKYAGLLPARNKKSDMTKNVVNPDPSPPHSPEIRHQATFPAVFASSSLALIASTSA